MQIELGLELFKMRFQYQLEAKRHSRKEFKSFDNMSLRYFFVLFNYESVQEHLSGSVS